MLEVYDQLPFPRLVCNDGDWEAEVVLPVWSGFQTRRGWYNGVSSPDPSDGSVRLRVIRPRGESPPPSAEQAAAYLHLLAHGSAVRDAILAAVFAEYPTFRSEYLDCFDKEDDEFVDIAVGVPELSQADELRSLMGLGNVFILPEVRDGIAYVGLEFGCVWEEGHGLGVLTHVTRIIEIGQAPTAFDGHAATKDATGGWMMPAKNADHDIVREADRLN